MNGKAIDEVDDVVKSVNGGELAIHKKGLITLRGGVNNDYTYVDVYTSIFDTNAAASKARKIFTYPNSGPAFSKIEETEKFIPSHYKDPKDNKLYVQKYTGDPRFFRPAVSRRLYNGKRAFLFHNLAINGELKYYFKTLSNNITEFAAGKTPDELVNSIQITDFGEYTPKKFPNAEKFISEVYGTGAMSVKDYDREIFVVASGPGRAEVEEGRIDSSASANPGKYYKNIFYDCDSEVRLEFFAINADDEGKMTQEPLTELTHETPFRGEATIISAVVGDFDGDRYDNEVAVMINMPSEIRLFVYRLILLDGKLALRSMGDPKGIQVYAYDVWLSSMTNDNRNREYPLELQPVVDMVAGDFDGKGEKEIAILYKKPWRATALKHDKSWPEGPVVGDVRCKVYKWNADKNAFDTAETVKDYHGEKINTNDKFDPFFKATVTGVVGLRAAAADLNGDGRDEIATVLLGYYYYRSWDSDSIFAYRRDTRHFYVWPHLAVWKFGGGSITPIHDDAHVKGGGDSAAGIRSHYDFGPLYELVKNQKTTLLGDKPFWEYVYEYSNFLQSNSTYVYGSDPNRLEYMYAPRVLSIAAGPFTGTFGTFRTADDIAIAWRDSDGNDCVTIFKTKVTNGTGKGEKEFDGFEDGKIAVKDKSSARDNGTGTYRGLVAVDMASEGVELGTPVHIRKESERSYVVALNAIPYHIDNINTNGTALTEQPTNFTYSDELHGGRMSVTYGKATTDSKTNTVKQDLSQSVETMFLFDSEAKGGDAFGKVKGVLGFVSGIATIANGIKIEKMTPEQRQDAVWKPDAANHPLTMIQGLLDFVTDRVDRINEKTNETTSTTIIDRNLVATTHDTILYTSSARHIWRYPVLTRPLPMWLAVGPRMDSTQIVDPSTVTKGDKDLFITFTMSENSTFSTTTSASDSKYQPLHEEGNFFSYPSSVAEVEGYNTPGLLTENASTWDFSTSESNESIKFTKATSDMQHTETKVTPSGFTSTISFFERLFKGNDTQSIINMPNSDNPKTFSKAFSTEERIGYRLKGSSNLPAHTADHTVKMQPFVAKEGTMVFATAVQLKRDLNASLWSDRSLYQTKPDPALYLPFKFVIKTGGTAEANKIDDSAMLIRGMKFYVPEFAFFSDNRFVKGQNYEVHVPLYNASFKDTGNFAVRLSWANENTMAAKKNIIGTCEMSLGGWGNNNKGTAKFKWTPDLTSNKKYYFYVEIDPDNNLKDEVHEERYSGGKISDYGGNNTGFYPFYVYEANDPKVSVRISAADEIKLTPLYFTDSDGRMINDMAKFILDEHQDESFVTITANFTYSGPETPYAFLTGYVLTQSGKQKIPAAGINTIVDANDLSFGDVAEVFMMQDLALFNGSNQVTLIISPRELIKDAENITAKADLITFGIDTITEDEILEAYKEFYEGEYPSFDLDPIPDDTVSVSRSETYTVTANENVFWLISSVKFKGNASMSAEDDSDSDSDSDSESEDDDRDYLDIYLEFESADLAPIRYGKEVNITVSSRSGYTPKGDFEITVQKSADGKEWENAEVLTFNSANSEGIGSNNIMTSSSGGCNTGLGLATFALLLSGFKTFRKRR